MIFHDSNQSQFEKFWLILIEHEQNITTLNHNTEFDLGTQ